MRFVVNLVCLAFLTSGWVWTEAAASPNRKLARQARKHQRAGVALLKKGKYDRAIEELQIAYGLVEKPIVLFHLAEAHNGKGEYTQALYYYRAYKEEHPRGAERRGVDALIEALAALEEVESPAEDSDSRPGESSAGDRPESEGDRPGSEAPPGASPGSDTPSGGRAGAGVSSGDRPAGERLSEGAPEEALLSPPRGDLRGSGAGATTGASSGRGLRVAGGIVSGAGLVVLAGAGYFGKVARDRESEISKYFAREVRWDSEYDAKYEEGRNARRNALILAGAGGAVVLTGAVLYYLGHRAGRSVRVEVGAVSGGGAVSWSCDF